MYRVNHRTFKILKNSETCCLEIRNDEIFKYLVFRKRLQTSANHTHEQTCTEETAEGTYPSAGFSNHISIHTF